MSTSDIKKIDFSIGLNLGKSFPLDTRTIFDSYEEAAAAASTAVEVGKEGSVYYWGQIVSVATSKGSDVYVITPKNTLKLLNNEEDLENYGNLNSQNVWKDVQYFCSSLQLTGSGNCTAGGGLDAPNTYVRAKEGSFCNLYVTQILKHPGDGCAIYFTLPNSSGTLLTSEIADDTYLTAEDLSTVYKYKGSIATYDDLPESGCCVGDVYNIEDSGNNYAWTGSEWDSLSGITDLDDYYTKCQVDEKLKAYPTDTSFTELTNSVSTNTQNISTNTSNINSLTATVNQKANSADVYTKTCSDALFGKLACNNTWTNSQTINGGLTVTGSNGTISSTGKITTCSSISATGDVTSSENITATKNISAGNYVSVGKGFCYGGNGFTLPEEGGELITKEKVDGVYGKLGCGNNWGNGTQSFISKGTEAEVLLNYCGLSVGFTDDSGHNFAEYLYNRIYSSNNCSSLYFPSETGTIATQEYVNNLALSGDIELTGYAKLSGGNTWTGDQTYNGSTISTSGCVVANGLHTTGDLYFDAKEGSTTLGCIVHGSKKFNLPTSSGTLATEEYVIQAAISGDLELTGYATCEYVNTCVCSLECSIGSSINSVNNSINTINTCLSTLKCMIDSNTAAINNVKNHVHHTFTSVSDLNSCVTSKDGDTAVVKVLISGTTDKYSYTAYVRDNEVWQPMDGNYSVDNVYMSGNIMFTEGVGAVTIPSEGFCNIDTDGMTVRDFFNKIFAVEKEPKVTQPSISVSSDSMGEYEVGCTVSIPFTITQNIGKYSYGPSTGVTFSSFNTTLNGETKSGSSGTFSIKIEDDTNATLQSTGTHTAGVTPYTNKGNASTSTAAISAGSKTYTHSKKLTGFRKSFWGTSTSKVVSSNLNSTFIRSLSGNGKKVDGDSIEVSISQGDLSAVIAYPESLGTLKSIIDVNGMSANILNSFTRLSVSVFDATGNSGATNYYVYYLNTDKVGGWDENTYIVNI